MSWLVAKSLDLIVCAEHRGTYVAVVNNNRYDPLQDLTQVMDIMQTHVDCIERYVSGVFSALSKDVVGYGETIPLASLRAFVVSKLGQQVSVPSCLLNR